MNLKTATVEALEDLYLPDEALAALAAGEAWEYTPDSIEGADADVSYCDDCDTYHLTWDVWGLRLDADGTLYETWTAVDSDGDWSFVDEYPYEEFDHAKECAAVRERWREYAKYVVRTGLDPVGEFSSRETRTLKRTFIVRFSDSIVGPKVTGVRPNKGKYAPLTEQPAEVRTFFEGIEEFKDIDDMRSRAHGLTWTGPNRAKFTLDFPRAEGATKAAIKRRAALHLAS